MGKPLQFIITLNDWLEGVPKATITSFNNMIGTGEKLAQGKIDAICAWLAWKVNIAIERQRQNLIKALHEQYVSNQQGPVMKVANAIMNFVSDPLGAIGSFASAIAAPVKRVFEWIKILVTEIPRLAENLANIVSALPPAPPNPHINYDKFQLKVKSVSLKEIMKGTAGLKSPEEMFPEPPKPFSKESFEADFNSTAVTLKSNSKMYELKPEDKEAILKNKIPSVVQEGVIDYVLNPASFSVDGLTGNFDNTSIDNDIA